MYLNKIHSCYLISWKFWSLSNETCTIERIFRRNRLLYWCIFWLKYIIIFQKFLDYLHYWFRSFSLDKIHTFIIYSVEVQITIKTIHNEDIGSKMCNIIYYFYMMIIYFLHVYIYILYMVFCMRYSTKISIYYCGFLPWGCISSIIEIKN